MPAAIAFAVFVALTIGWVRRDEEILTPDSGVGYWLGIVGGLMMLTLLLYSVRKRQKSIRALGSIPLWFRIHMFLGVAGPVLIMFHSNFHLGALNSNVALFTMLTVAFSGVIGRYIYGKIHMGLYGRKAVAKEILADAEALAKELGPDMAATDAFKDLGAFGKRVMDQPPSTALSSLVQGAMLHVQSRLLRNRVLAEARKHVIDEGKANGWSFWQRRRRLAEVNEIVTAYFKALLKAAELRFYERLFSLWHVLHLPLFFVMVLAALVHVWAAHRY